MRLLGAAQQFQGTLVDSTFAHLAVEARDGFCVVIQHIGPRRKNYIQRVPIAAKIRDEDFHFAAGHAAPNFFELRPPIAV